MLSIRVSILCHEQFSRSRFSVSIFLSWVHQQYLSQSALSSAAVPVGTCHSQLYRLQPSLSVHVTVIHSIKESQYVGHVFTYCQVVSFTSHDDKRCHHVSSSVTLSTSVTVGHVASTLVTIGVVVIN